MAAVIGNYEGEGLLPDVLESLAAQTRRPDEVVVVDAQSTDASVAVAERYGARTIVVPNNGLGFLYNRGVEATSAEHVLLLNNDVALDERCVELLTNALDEDDDRFAADPRQVRWDGSTLVHARTTLRRGGYLHHLLPGFVLDLKTEASSVLPTVCTNGGAMIIRRSSFVALGGFDESFFLDFEDLDLGWRAWLVGQASVHVPAAVVRHRVGAVTTASVATRRLVSSHHNLMRFALKCLPAREAFGVVATEFARLGIHPRLVAPALAAIAVELPEIARLRRESPPSRAFLDWVLDGMDDTPPGRRP